ncbi:MAG: 3-hydroxyisobutyrate dehydrogenase [Alphaproteobacteria bacterium]|nr:3-hydroxyisobutyrate dehydrogenase [Alphaproteobacteria bacterium]
MTKQNIGFIGLGHMGLPMAHNLIKAGFKVKIYDVMDQNVSKAASLGGEAVSSLKQIPDHIDVMITMLPSGKEVKEVYQHLLPIIQSGTLLIDCSTIDVETARMIAEEAAQKKILMVDAPVSGGVTGAEKATLTFMVGGPLEAFKKAEPILKIMGKSIIHAGSSGNGQAVKICNNMMLAIQMLSVAEGFALAEKLGVSTKTLFDVSAHASGQCWSLTSYCPEPELVPTAPSNHNFEPGFTANMMYKDLRLATQAAQSNLAAIPLGAEATSLYALFCNNGNGMKDFSAIIQMIKGKNNINP